uniref:Transcription elongation factor 1 homolog n=1 Tax=Strigamia maritima TaxID=126957 RepID=T1JE46_STRMM
MGRKKSQRKPPPKRKAIESLPTKFDCSFCNHQRSCEVNMDFKKKTAMIMCNVCFEDFQTRIHMLSEPIDVFSDWIDACERANK